MQPRSGCTSARLNNADHGRLQQSNTGQRALPSHMNSPPLLARPSPVAGARSGGQRTYRPPEQRRPRQVAAKQHRSARSAQPHELAAALGQPANLAQSRAPRCPRTLVPSRCAWPRDLVARRFRVVQACQSGGISSISRPANLAQSRAPRCPRTLVPSRCAWPRDLVARRFRHHPGRPPTRPNGPAGAIPNGSTSGRRPERHRPARCTRHPAAGDTSLPPHHPGRPPTRPNGPAGAIPNGSTSGRRPERHRPANAASSKRLSNKPCSRCAFIEHPGRRRYKDNRSH